MIDDGIRTSWRLREDKPEISFGHGQLDIFGYWEFGCNTCARDYEAEHPGETAWPHARASWGKKGGVKPQKLEGL